MRKIKLNFRKLFLMTLLISSSLIVFQSCLDDDYESQSTIDDKLIVKYLDDNNIQAEKEASGYYYTIMESNESGDEVKDDDILSVYYTMSLLNGEKIDSVVSGEPIKFKMKNDALVPVGLRFGSYKMKEGEKFRFIIPSNLAYFNYHYENIIPPNSILIVESEIVKIETEQEQKTIEKNAIDNYIVDNSVENISETTSGLYYKKVSDGDGDMPGNNEIVNVKLVVKYLDGEEIYSTEEGKSLSFRIGNGSAIAGLEEGVQLMQKGEKALLILPSHLAYNESLQVFPEKIREDLIDKDLIVESILPFSILEIEVELVDGTN